MRTVLAFVASCASLFSAASATIYFAGVAESSGEFGVWSATSTPGTGLPGTFGTDYAFISESAVDVHVDKNKVGPAPQKALPALRVVQGVC